jgi:TPR repeat protein
MLSPAVTQAEPEGALKVPQIDKAELSLSTMASVPTTSLAALESRLAAPQELPSPPVVQPRLASPGDASKKSEPTTDAQPPPINGRQLAQVEEVILSRRVMDDNTDALQPLAAAFGPLEAAAERGDPAAAYDVAYCYEHGIGVRPDRVKAYAYYIRAAGAPAGLKVRAAAFSGAQALIVKLSDEEYNAARQMLQSDTP